MPRRGLPRAVKMRHDEHYVEALAASSGAPIGRMIPIDQVDPNPDQPRQVMGDLSELMASIVEKGIIEKSGSWYSYGDLRLGQGKENSRDFLKENPDVLEEVDARVRDSLGLGDEPEAEEASDEPKVEPLKEAAVSGGG